MKHSNKSIAVFMSCAIAFTAILPVNAQETKSDPEEEVTEEILEMGWNGFLRDGTLSYVSESGEKLVGFHEIDGQLYYFGDDRTVCTGWIEIDENQYFFSPENGKA